MRKRHMVRARNDTEVVAGSEVSGARSLEDLPRDTEGGVYDPPVYEEAVGKMSGK